MEHAVSSRGVSAAFLREFLARTNPDHTTQDVCDAILAGVESRRDVDPRRVDLVRLQDDIAQVGQGVRADRRYERFGRGDIGVAVTRRLWLRELKAMRDGGALKDWQWAPDIVPRAWAVSPGAVGSSTLGVAGGGEPEFIDIRPPVEIALQRRALHGQSRLPAALAVALQKRQAAR